jgi:CBS domain containing-hemolysin-like protein
MDIARLVQSSVAPVFLLSGVATTLSVLTSRLARIVDRARRLEEQLASHPGSATQLYTDLRVLSRRANYINTAISLCAIAALLVALVVVALFANAFFGSDLASVIALLFVGAMVCLSAAFITFFVEVRVAIAALRIGLPSQRSTNRA